jgi:hypothetical protein
MKRAFLAFAIVVLIVSTAHAQGAKPDFTGTWSLDLAKSDFGPTPPPESSVMVVEHKEPSVKIKLTQKSAQGETVNDRTITTDGKENSNVMRTMMGDQPVTSTSTWTGNKLTTSSKLDVQGMSIEIADAWELSEDTKVLTVTRDLKTPQGDFTMKLLFNKQ